MSYKEEHPYSIRYAKKEDRDLLLNFLRDHWNKDLIFVKDSDYFDYEHWDQFHDRYNFVIAKEKETGQLVGCLGFIKYQKEDKEAHIHTVLWKVISGLSHPSLGIDLLVFLQDRPFLSISSLGINKRTKGIYRYLKFNLGQLKHFVLINPEIENFQIGIFREGVRIIVFILSAMVN